MGTSPWLSSLRCHQKVPRIRDAFCHPRDKIVACAGAVNEKGRSFHNRMPAGLTQRLGKELEVWCLTRDLSLVNFQSASNKNQGNSRSAEIQTPPLETAMATFFGEPSFRQFSVSHCKTAPVLLTVTLQ
jgi:hypothetical protein